MEVRCKNCGTRITSPLIHVTAVERCSECQPEEPMGVINETANQLADRNRQLAAVCEWMAQHAREPGCAEHVKELSTALLWSDADVELEATREEQALAVAERAVGIAERLFGDSLKLDLLRQERRWLEEDIKVAQANGDSERRKDLIERLLAVNLEADTIIRGSGCPGRQVILETVEQLNSLDSASCTVQWHEYLGWK